jgi:Carboxypeptidase regulatory-like domain
MNPVSVRWCIVSLLLLCVVGLATMAGQTDRGSITGTVTDASGAVLPGARIDLGQKGPSAVSDAQGQFLITNLPPGSYTINISYVGFTPFSATAIVKPDRPSK